MIFPGRVVREWVGEVLAGAMQPEPDEEVWEWAERTLRFPAGGENEEMEGEPLSFAITPYVRELLEWSKRPGKGEFWIKKSAQTGFTLAVLVLICWMVRHRPGNVVYAINNVDEARKISKTRLRRWITENRLLERIGESDDDLSNLTYYLRGMTVYLIGAHSKGAWRNKRAVLFVLDELDAHPFVEGDGTTPALARQRCKAPKNTKIIGFSTPGENGLITKMHAQGTQEVIDVPCPHCGHYQALEWENFVFGTDEFRLLVGTGAQPGDEEKGEVSRDYDMAAVRAGAYFRCTSCAGRIVEDHKREILQACVYRATNETAEGRIRSLHIWDAYSPFLTFGELAVSWIEVQGEAVEVDSWMRNCRGMEPARAGSDLAAEDVLGLRGPYRRGSCPVTPDWVSMTVDVQAGRDEEVGFLRWVKFGHTLKGDFYVLDWGKALPDMENLVDVADMPIDCPGGSRVVESGLIDDGHRSKDVRRFCYWQEPRFYPVKGGHLGYNLKRHIDVKMDAQVQLPEGFAEIKLYQIDDDGCKWQARRFLRGGAGEDKGRREKERGRLWLPEDADSDEEFVDEFVNEAPQLEANRWGVSRWRWRVKGPNEALDCLKYALVLWAVTEPVVREFRQVDNAKDNRLES